MSELVNAFFPAVSRVRRAASTQERGYLDSIVLGMGAYLDRQHCRDRVTCSAGKSLQHNVPGAQVAIMLMEAIVPKAWMPRYSTLKTSIMDRSDSCHVEYECELLEN